MEETKWASIVATHFSSHPIVLNLLGSILLLLFHFFINMYCFCSVLSRQGLLGLEKRRSFLKCTLLDYVI